MLHKTLNSYFHNVPWDEDPHPEGHLWLIEKEELDNIPDGTVLESIDGSTKVKGHEELNLELSAHMGVMGNEPEHTFTWYGLRGRE